MNQTIKAICPFCQSTNQVEKGGNKYSMGECEACGEISLMENQEGE